MTVYIDVLFLINFIINMPVLYLTGKIARLSPSNGRIVFGALCGALYGVFMFFPRLSFIYGAMAKVLFSLFVVAITFRVRGVRLYIKTVGVFYLVTFCLGGGVMALFYFTGMGQSTGALIKNGILYMNLPPGVLFASVGICYVILRIIWGILQNRMAQEAMHRKVGIFWNGKEVWLDALLDTGNALSEPFSGAPVIVAEMEQLLPVLPAALRFAIDEDGEARMETIEDEAVRSRIRMIPFSSLGKEHGMLIGFRPDGAVLLENEALKDAGEVVVAIYTRRLAKDRSFGALLPPGILGGNDL
ncbi:MAG: sigma-E processing peptidase SpoIIGA [Clostridia bacterium]|nr:sigma-E processing peptidase SpoIIGA [Clostridia bacterium]